MEQPHPPGPDSGASQPCITQARDCVSEAHAHANMPANEQAEWAPHLPLQTEPQASRTPLERLRYPGPSWRHGHRPHSALCVVPGRRCGCGSSRGCVGQVQARDLARWAPALGRPASCVCGAAHRSGLSGPRWDPTRLCSAGPECLVCTARRLVLQGPVDARSPRLRTEHGRWVRGNPPVWGQRETQAPPQRWSLSPQFLLQPGGSSCPRAGVRGSGRGLIWRLGGKCPIYGIDLGTRD